MKIKRVIICAVIVFIMLLGVIPLLIFREKANITAYSIPAIVVLVGVTINGLLALASKDKHAFSFFDRCHSHYYKYNRPTTVQLKEFYLYALIYFAPIPLYIPIVFFATSYVQSLWCLLLLLIPEFTFIFLEMRLHFLERKQEKQKEQRELEEKKEQERREELGRWK